MPTARDVMKTDPVTIPHTATVGQAIQILLASAVDSAPVVDGRGRLVGVVDEAHLLVVFYDDDTRDKRVTALLTKDVSSVETKTPLAEVGKTLSRSGAARLMVLEKGRLVGSISRADLVQYLALVPPDSRRALAGAVAGRALEFRLQPALLPGE
jgi:CBS domain-containing protein